LAINGIIFFSQQVAHGSCSELAPEDYFQKTIDFDEKYNISNWLSAQNIEPSNEKTVKKTDFIAAIQKHVADANFVLKCEEVTASDNSKHNWFKEIMICVTKDVKSLRKCGDEMKTDCPDDFYYIQDRTKEWGPTPTTPTVAPTSPHTDTQTSAPTTAELSTDHQSTQTEPSTTEKQEEPISTSATE